MTLNKRKMESRKKSSLKDLNEIITCSLCRGYLVDATTLVDCLHYFCRSCILKYFENNRTACPSCNTLYKKKTQSCFRSDPQLQSLVYKVVPGLYSKEMQRREDFYRSTGVRASSSCSDDSVIDRERDLINDQEDMISAYVGDRTQFFGPDDLISLSLEYYQVHLDTTDLNKPNNKDNNTLKSDKTDTGDLKSETDVQSNNDKTKPGVTELSKTNSNSDCVKSDGNSSKAVNGHKDSISETSDNKDDKSEHNKEVADKRFLQCPAAVSMKHLQKFIRMKYALTGDHRVDIIYQGEVLPVDFSLMDVAYTFKWERVKPMRFFYRIFTPMKRITPIKIVNTTLSTGGKQLQIVPVKPNSDTNKTFEKQEQPSSSEKKWETPRENVDRYSPETEDQKNHKERLFAHLQLQSKSKVQTPENKVPEKTQDCIYDKNEESEEERRKFAEKRDREWALQKKLDESKEEIVTTHHFSKKRKKNKHSKNEFMHKKRKLHAEITSNEEEDLKLKVKITTQNGHKHKHHKSSSSSSQQYSDKSELSSKEKLLQMRQVRHKHVHNEEKKTVPTTTIKISRENHTTEHAKVSKPPAQIITNPSKNNALNNKVEDDTIKEDCKNVEEKVIIKPEPIEKLTIKQIAEPVVSKPNAPNPEQSTNNGSNAKNNNTTTPKPIPVNKTAPSKEWGKNKSSNERSEQDQKTFLKTFQSYAEKYHKSREKINQNKIENNNKQQQIKNNNINTNNKTLDRKIANLQQHCTIEAKIPAPTIVKEKTDKKVSFSNEKSQIIPTQYPAGFTVSKIETGVKRKTEENETVQDKRPSLEITLINPPSTTTISPLMTSTPKTIPEGAKSVAKRPPPATIPLERIKKSGNLSKSGISIIPKIPEKCDNIGALDLSNPNKSPENSPKSESKTGLNGFNITPIRQPVNNCRPQTAPPEKASMQLSNLQMLSKVATEHPTLNNKTQNNLVNRPRAPVPNLQTLKIPSLQNPGGINNKPTPNLQKMPKLTEIQKFRPTNPQIRNLRPNQNQSIRNIPNPSLLIKQQRLNSMSFVQSSTSIESTTNRSTNSGSVSVANNIKDNSNSFKSAIKSESKVTENKEISV